MVAIAASWVLNLKLTRDLVVAVSRATIQLLAVGFGLSLLGSASTQLWAWIWAAGMIAVSTSVLARRSPPEVRANRRVPVFGGLLLATCAAGTALLSFGLGVFEYKPITMLVVVGLTIGNAMPSAVLAIKQTHTAAIDRSGEIEALLASGATRKQAVSYLAQRPAKLALTAQVERTKVVGLIALPGAMAGLLLAGTDPIEAVMTQLFVMVMVLGSVALAVIAMSLTIASLVVAPDLRIASWLRSSTAEL